MVSQHSNIEHKCNECGYVTKKKQLLNRHTIIHHSTVKPFVCESCNKSFKLKRALTVHLKQHTQKIFYPCNFCERTFSSSTNFYTHRKNMHPKELKALRQGIEEQERLKRVNAGVEKLDDTVTIVVHPVESNQLLESEHVLIATG
jgi:Zinc finger, C2H2 type/C2H2-type zinc finger